MFRSKTTVIFVAYFNTSILIIVHHCGAAGSMRVCHEADPGSIPRMGQVSWVRFFLGFPSPVRQMSRSFSPSKSPNIILPPKSSFHIHLVRMNGCVNDVYHLSYSCCLEGGPGIGLITQLGKPSMFLCGQKSIM